MKNEFPRFSIAIRDKDIAITQNNVKSINIDKSLIQNPAGFFIVFIIYSLRIFIILDHSLGGCDLLRYSVSERFNNIYLFV